MGKSSYSNSYHMTFRLSVLLLPLVVYTCYKKTEQYFKSSNWLQDNESDSWFIVYTILLCTFLALKIIIVIDELCKILEINCFDITTQRKGMVPIECKQTIGGGKKKIWKDRAPIHSSTLFKRRF